MCHESALVLYRMFRAAAAAFAAAPTLAFAATWKEPVLENVIPKKQYSFTISIGALSKKNERVGLLPNP